MEKESITLNNTEINILGPLKDFKYYPSTDNNLIHTLSKIFVGTHKSEECKSLSWVSTYEDKGEPVLIETKGASAWINSRDLERLKTLNNKEINRIWWIAGASSPVEISSVGPSTIDGYQVHVLYK